MSVRVMTAVWEVDLPASQKIVLLALADCANDEGVAWPSIATIAKKASKSERTVQAMVADLEKAGHLKREQSPGKGCRYFIHPRKSITPAKSAPVQVSQEPPQNLHPTPAKSAPKPSKNHQEPSMDSASDDAPPTKSEVMNGWNLLASECGLPRVGKLTAQRDRQLKARLREYPEIQSWQSAFASIRGSPFLRGQNDRGWKADFDFLLQPKSFTKLVEGSYGS